MAPGIILLVSEKNESDNNFAKFLEFVGIPYVLASSQEMLRRHMEEGIKCLAASSHTIRKYKNTEDELHEQLSYMLIYEAECMQSPVNSPLVTINRRREICRELSGLSFKPSNEIIPALKANDRNIEELISIGKNPFFVSKKKNHCEIFLLPIEIIDINKKVLGRLSQDDCFIKIIPIAMFLRHILPEYFRIGNDRYACLIIDDPLLRERYGFIDYYKLLSLMDKYNFFTTLGFIPRNYNRTDKEIAELFTKRADKFGICVHGCDHTGGEFGKRDREYLEKKINLSTARMIEHERITGIPFDRVMVFPQGVFSTQAMEALLRNGYLAAVNSVPVPVGREELLDASDYLRCNIMKYGNFPLFMRRLPESLIDFAFDLFWGKPIFLVIHNEYLKKGYDQLIDCIVKINSLSENIKWKSAGSIIENFVAKKTSNGFDIANVDLRGFGINGLNETMKILIRRFAFEFRDNYLCRHDTLLNLAARVKNLIVPQNIL